MVIHGSEILLNSKKLFPVNIVSQGRNEKKNTFIKAKKNRKQSFYIHPYESRHVNNNILANQMN